MSLLFQKGILLLYLQQSVIGSCHEAHKYCPAHEILGIYHISDFKLSTHLVWIQRVFLVFLTKI
jgi:hypothetical protein